MQDPEEQAAIVYCVAKSNALLVIGLCTLDNRTRARDAPLGEIEP
jgi:hypothetical protein